MTVAVNSVLSALTARNPAPRVAVFRALQLGDMLCSIPAIRALRGSLPAAHITLIGLPWARVLVDRYPQYFHAFLEFPGHPGMPERPADLEAFPAFLEAARRARFDLAVQMHGDGTITNPLVALLGAEAVAGFYRPDGDCPEPAYFTPWPEHGHEIERLLGLTGFLGAPRGGEHLEFPLTAADEAELHTAAGIEALVGEPYVCVHPGSQLPSRRWPTDRFVAVADALAAEGMRVVLTGSTGEAPLTAAVARQMRAPVLDLAGRTSLGALGVLLRDARMLVCNDTGVSHIASALRVPSVVLASGSDVARWAPLDRTRHRTLWHDVACRPCSYVECPINGHPCATGVSVEAVIGEARALLRTETRIGPPAQAAR